MTTRSHTRALTVLVGVLVLVVLTIVIAPSASGQGRARVVLVTGFCDSGSLICQPFTSAVRRSGVPGRIVSPDSREDPVATLSLLARQGHELIIVDPFWGETLARVAPKFPKQRFAVIDIPLSYLGRPRNVQSIIVRVHEASYLAGWLATKMEQRRPGRDVIGVVGGEKFAPVEDFVVGFRAGARAASPKVRVLTGYANDFADPTKCEAIARRQIARGAGVVLQVANRCGLGALRAAKRARVWGIGVDWDQSSLGPHILTSIVKKYDTVMLTLLRQVRDGRIRAGVTTEVSLRGNGAGLGRISPRVPSSLRTELDQVRRRIIRGEIRVPGV